MLNICLFLLKNIVFVLVFIILICKKIKLINLVKIVSVFLLFFLFSNQYKINRNNYQNKLAYTTVGQKISNVRLTFYDGCAQENGGYAGLNARPEVNGGKLALGQVAAYQGFLLYHTIIYVEGPSSGEGSYANGKYFYVADTGAFSDEHIDIAVVDSKNLTAHNPAINNAPYGTGFGTVTIVKMNATWDDYVKNYLNKNGWSGVGISSGHTYKYGKCTVNDGGYDGDVKDGYIYKRFENTLFKNLHSTKDIENRAVDIIQDIFDDTIEMYGNPSYCTGDSDEENGNSCGVNTSMWWPVGSNKTTKEGGETFASGNPVSVTISSPFTDARTLGGTTSAHRGIDISSDGYAPGKLNVIAALDGTVVYPTSDSQTHYADNGSLSNNDGGGFGNYVVIEHSNGLYTYYGHMAQDSITVKSGDKVKQGQVIGKMGHSGRSTGTHLHFEVRVGSQDKSSAVDPTTYVSSSNPRPKANALGSSWSLTTTSLTKKEFKNKMNSYCKKSGNQDFCNNFSNNSDTIYEASKDSNVNPELVVVTAGTEESFKNRCDNYNFWGIGISNGKPCSAGPSFSSMSDAVAGYAKTIQDYLKGGSKASMIEERYEAREAGKCDCAGHGHAGTLEGMQSVYSWLGNYRYSPGDSGLGGCYYLNENMYEANYCSKHPVCTNYSSCPADSKTTVCEQNDYTAWQIKNKKKLRFDIFGL